MKGEPVLMTGSLMVLIVFDVCLRKGRTTGKPRGRTRRWKRFGLVVER